MAFPSLGIGTVQFGMEYGILDHDRRPSSAEIGAIVGEALAANVALFDTAPGYGDSEELLGRVLPPDDSVRIITKTTALPAEETEIPRALSEALDGSLARLRRSSIDTVLIHNPRDSKGNRGRCVIDTLGALKADGKLRRIGVSLYDAEEIAAIEPIGEIDCLQVPVNLLDQRLIQGGLLGELRKRGIEIVARSAFLQGLLLMPPGAIPEFFAAARPMIEALHTAARDNGATPLAACLGYLRAQVNIDSVVVGIKEIGQLREVLAAWTTVSPMLDWSSYCCAEPAILDPRRWPPMITEQ